MTTIQEFSKSIEEKQKAIYQDLENFVSKLMGQKDFVPTTTNEIYLSDPDSYNGDLRLIHGIQKSSKEIWIRMEEAEFNEDEPNFYHYPLKCFLVDDVLNVISNCFE